MMIKNLLKIFLVAMLFVASIFVLAADDAMPVWIGKGNYLFIDLDAWKNWNEHWQVRQHDNSLRAIARINQAFKEKGVRLVVAIVPIRERILTEFLPDGYVLPNKVSRLYDKAMKFFASSGVVATDLNSAFLKSPERLAELGLFLRQDHHWSSVGAFVAAQEVAKTINAKFGGALANLPKVDYVFNWLPPETMSYNTAYRDYLSDEQRASLPLEIWKPYAFDLLVPQSNLLGDSTAKIAVVGTSFSRVTRLGFVDALSLRLSKEVANLAENNKGYWEPLIDYVSNEAFLESPPRVLVWEIPESQLDHCSLPPGVGEDILKFASNVRNEIAKLKKKP